MSIEQTAEAVFTTVSSGMADGVTEITTRRGYDIRDFSLLACGGGGALCGAHMAELLNTKNVLIPEFAASFCAWSMFCLDVGRDYIRTYISQLGKADTKTINKLFDEMIDEALREFEALHVTREQMQVSMSADVRYLGQFHEIEMSLPHQGVAREDLDRLEQEFHQKHKELFTFMLPQASIEVRSLRLIATIKSEAIDLPKLDRPSHGQQAIKRRRPCFFKGEWLDTPIYDSSKVGSGDVIKGHAIVETPTTTIVIPPHFVCTVDQYGTYILTKED
jgi:N-methylhydantoinase A